MMMNKISKFFLFLFLISSLSLFAQDQQQQGTSQQQDQILDLGEIKIDARVELPQVQILDKRLEPDFEDIKTEKSFQSELSSASEQLKFTAITSGKVRPIENIKELLNKKRF
jgi:hypothetical protein